MKIGEYKEPAGLLPLGEHLVAIVESKVAEKKEGRNPQIELQYGHGTGSPCCDLNSRITDFLPITENSLFRIQQVVAAVNGRQASQITGDQWRDIFEKRGFGGLDTDREIAALAAYLGKQIKPFLINVIEQPDNSKPPKMRPRIDTGLINKGQGIRPCSDTEAAKFVKYSAQTSEDGLGPSVSEDDDLPF